jgi:hypothetical protein
MPHLDKSDIEIIAQQVIAEEGLEISEVQTFEGVTIPDVIEEASEKPAIDVEVQSEDGVHVRARIDVSPERDPDEIKEGIRELLNKRIDK